MLKQRVLTALILLPVALAGIFLLPLPGFTLAVGAIIVLAAREWGALIRPQDGFIKIAYAGAVAALVAALIVLVPEDLLWSEQRLHPLAHGVLLAGALWWLVGLALVLSYPRSARMWSRSAGLKSLFGQLTLLPCFVALVVLKSWPGMANDNGAWLVLAVLLLVWGADTGAYFVGKAVGKNKLIPRVSPGKTREGLLGGMAVCALLGVLGAYLVPGLSLVEALALALITGLASALGDLTESMFKRAANIKDSGRLLPGHGGILDRIDSVTAAMPVFALLYLYFGI
ncbi:phosphatidate cytidylyltransferase [Ferrimonas balearica]|uniref:phosphatidate cytidylyltransferase n=1 Tax=Ferrimonas balearica TaxID=44012 RepID=UPI001C98EB8C|nr:phosphatidate cytidylyltransferase [Ferrimonas balearica]MBY5990662.1 phosphatidate cytidylyltransferase [Ferrimonas balearica]